MFIPRPENKKPTTAECYTFVPPYPSDNGNKREVRNQNTRKLADTNSVRVSSLVAVVEVT